MDGEEPFGQVDHVDCDRRVDQLLRQVADLKSDLDWRTKEHNDCKDNLCKVTRQREEVVKKVNHFGDELFSLRSEAKTLEVERDLARQRVKKLLKQNLGLQVDLSQARAQVEALHKKIEADRAEAARVNRTKYRDPWVFEKQLERARETGKVLSSRINTLVEQRDKALTERDQAQQAWDINASYLADGKAALDVVQRQRDIYCHRWEQANEQIATRGKCYRALVNDYHAIRREREEARHIACRLLWDCKRLGEHLDDVMKRWKDTIESHNALVEHHRGHHYREEGCQPINKTIRICDLGIKAEEEDKHE